MLLLLQQRARTLRPYSLKSWSCSQTQASMVRRSSSFPSTPRRPKTPSRRLQEAPKTPKRPPRSLQDLEDDPKSTPKRPHVGTSGTSKKQQKHIVFDDFSRIQALHFTFCSMFFKNGLKISSRSLQERSEIPQDVLRPPTWRQHGANMGPTWAQPGPNMGSKKAPRSVHGKSICSPEGVSSSDCSPTAHMDPTWTPNAPQMNPKLGSCWDHLGVVLGSSWGHLGVILGSLWDHFGITLGSHWDHFGISVGSLWNDVRVTLG